MAVEIDNRATGLRRMPRGFGLIELMIVVAIIVILTMIALPSYQRLIQLNRLTSDTNTLLSAFNLARNEAVSRGRPVTVCASADGAACDGPGTGNWSNGWIVFTDYDPAGQVDAGAGDVVLRMFGPVSTHNTLSSIGANVGYVSFGRTGEATFPAAGTMQTFIVKQTPCVNDLVRNVTVTNLGRSASKTDATCP
jgi:type IV fimbrial biogenesis protein FimT